MSTYELYRDRDDVYVSNLDPLTGAPIHMHACFECVYAIDGEAEVEIDGKQYVFSTGEMAVIAGFSLHRLKTKRLGTFQITLMPHRSVASFDRIMQGMSFAEPIIKVGDELAKLLSLIYSAANDLGALDFSTEPERREEVLTQLSSMLCSVCIARCGLTKRERMSSLIGEAVGIIESEFRTDLRVSELARRLLCNQQELSEQFTSMLGEPIIAYINRLRTREVKRLLLSEPELTLDVIMQKSGFGSMRSMLRHFRSEYNCTPSEFRDSAVAFV